MATLALACGAPAAHEPVCAPAVEDVYLWQRRATPELARALATTGDTFARVRVLVGELPDAPDAGVDAALLAGRRVVAVVRVEGTGPFDGAAVGAHLARARAALTDAGAVVEGVEVDYDCPARALHTYARALLEVRGAIGQTPLSITALPSWALASGARARVPTRAGAAHAEQAGGLAAVRAAVDAVVLQLHAVDADAGLFRAARAEGQLARFAAAWRAGANGGAPPLWIALPAYGHPRARDGALWADPAEVARFLRGGSDVRTRVEGIVWFRLPVDGDDDTWDAATLAHVRARAPLGGSVRVVHEGADVVLVNEHPWSVRAPARVVFACGRARCDADAYAGFVVENAIDVAGADAGMGGAQERALVTAGERLVRPRERLRIGWVRARAPGADVAKLPEVTLDAR